MPDVFENFFALFEKNHPIIMNSKDLTPAIGFIMAKMI